MVEENVIENVEEVVEEAEQPEVKMSIPLAPLFGKYEMDGIQIRDIGLARYMNLINYGVPHHGAKYANRQFGKSKVPIVERFINGIMRTEVYTGKKLKATKAVEDAFELVHKRTKENPVQVFVRALENASPREETTRLRFGGINVPKAVDVAPQRRLDVALRNLCRGVVAASHKNKKSISECIADELVKASKNDPASFAVAKKDDLERIAKSAR
ncbi:MAG: 30S ribosomal protein S7 [Thermoplasmata archaeon HGW-Thermoplasmata-1]|nr:MAG: 30S ribosomal protein S7 [Thermoplasmata archaeon HGW-Thermoplasmata-1]